MINNHFGQYRSRAVPAIPTVAADGHHRQRHSAKETHGQNHHRDHHFNQRRSLFFFGKPANCVHLATPAKAFEITPQCQLPVQIQILARPVPVTDTAAQSA